MNIIRKFILTLVLLLSQILVNCNDRENGLLIIDSNNDEEEGIVTVDEEPESSELFVATNEWQPIKKGQIIAAGLHIRVNLETGLKEAKILDKHDQQFDGNSKFIDKYKKVIESESTTKSKLIKNQIKQVMKNLKFGQRLDSNSMTDSAQTESTFRSIDEIKSEFAEINMNIRSETEILENLLNKYNKSSVSERLLLLEDIEYLVHSLDVAQDFVKLNGIELLLSDLNSTDSKLRAEIAFTFGSAMNANPKVQIQVLKSGALHKLLLLLRYDSSDYVKKRAFFAISSLVRHFPTAQKVLIQEYGALSIFANLFKQQDINTIKLCSKVVTLLNDLFIEKEWTSKFAANDKYSQMKAKQYREIDLNRAIVEEGFCQLIPTLLNTPDNDVREKTIEAMVSFSSLCKNQFENSLEILIQISDQLNELSKKESESEEFDSYFRHLSKMTIKLINTLNYKLKDEL